MAFFAQPGPQGVQEVLQGERRQEDLQLHSPENSKQDCFFCFFTGSGNGDAET